jgi:hypothetical protein
MCTTQLPSKNLYQGLAKEKQFKKYLFFLDQSHPPPKIRILVQAEWVRQLVALDGQT